MKIIEPIKGYSSKNKEEYRKKIWSMFAEKILENVKNDPNGYVLLLPGKYCYEIETAISFGFPEEKIIAVEQNPAIIATSEWRKKYPSVKFFGCKVSEVGKKFKKNWVIYAANLDFCNNFSKEFIEETFLFFHNLSIYYQEMVVSITVMKGREDPVITYLMGRIWSGYEEKLGCKRLYCLLKELYERTKNRIPLYGINKKIVLRFNLLHHGNYLNSKTPMAFICLELVSNSTIRKKIEYEITDLIDINLKLHELDNVFFDKKNERRISESKNISEELDEWYRKDYINMIKDFSAIRYGIESRIEKKSEEIFHSLVCNNDFWKSFITSEESFSINKGNLPCRRWI
jgi:hypothetical protein